MLKINLYEAIELKRQIKTLFGVDLHYHDTCNGQFFSLDEPDESVRDWITNYFLEKNIAVIYNTDKTKFTLESSRFC